MNETIELVVCDMAGATVRAAGQVPQAFASALPASRRQSPPGDNGGACRRVHVIAAEL